MLRVSATETVEITGHLMDSGILSRILDDIREYGADWVITKIDVGHEASDASTATIDVTADDDESLQRLLMRLQTRGVNQVDPGEAMALVRAAAAEHGLASGLFCADAAEARRWAVAGFDLVTPGNDVSMLREAVAARLQTITDEASDVAPSRRGASASASTCGQLDAG